MKCATAKTVTGYGWRPTMIAPIERPVEWIATKSLTESSFTCYF